MKAKTVASDSSIQKARRFFFNAASIRAVHVVTAYAGSAAAPIRAGQGREPAVHATFRDEASAQVWLSGQAAEYLTGMLREYPAILLECTVGFVLFARLSKTDPEQYASAIMRAIRMSDQLADWQQDQGARACLADALLFRDGDSPGPIALSQFTFCDRDTEFYSRRLVRRRDACAMHVERNKNSAAILIDQVMALGNLHQYRDRSIAAPEAPPPAVRPQHTAPMAPAERAVGEQVNLVSPLHWSDDDLATVRRQTTPAVAVTLREQQSLARVGQGLFRKRVAEVETTCRVTGVSQLEHLRASHIKPWRDCSDTERLDADNGLMLSPHVDHLFDQGFLSFAPDGAVLFAPSLQEDVIKQWHLSRRVAARPFNSRQAAFMNYHRNHVFRSR